MPPDVERLLRDAAPRPRREVDVPSLVQRARRLDRNRRIATAAGAVAIVAVAATIVPESAAPERTEPAVTPYVAPVTEFAPTGPPAPGPLPSHRVASFSIRAVVHAGLHDLIGERFNYRGIEAVGEGWEVVFERRECYADGGARVEAFYRCREPVDPPGDPAALHVVRADGAIRVAELAGAWPDDARAALLAYTEEDALEPANFQYLQHLVVKDGGGLRLIGEALWTGPIPADGYRSWCGTTVFDEGGSATPLDSRPTEIVFGSNDEGSRDTSSFLTGVGDAPTRVETTCETWHGEGWRVVGEADLRVDPATSRARVRVTVVWDDPPYPVPERDSAVTFDCVANVYDARGRLRWGVETPPLPRPGDGPPPYRREIVVGVDRLRGPARSYYVSCGNDLDRLLGPPRIDRR